LREREKQLDTLQQRYDKLKEEYVLLQKQSIETEIFLKQTKDKNSKLEIRKMNEKRLDNQTIDKLSSQIEDTRLKKNQM